MNTDRDIVEYLMASLALQTVDHIEIRRLLSLLENENTQLSSLTPEQERAIALARIFSSNTLQKSDKPEALTALENWNNANLVLINLIQQGSQLTLHELVVLQNKLENSTDGFRTQKIFGNGEYISPEFLPELLQIFEKEVLQNELRHPLMAAAECYVWLSTLHPFPNGNGRTARLAADYFLLKNGYLPMTFRSPIAGHVAFLKNEFKPTKIEMLIKSLEAVSATYQLIK